MSSEEALAHPWMAFEPGDEATSRSLSKDRLKRFLARQKWKVTPQRSTSNARLGVGGVVLYLTFFLFHIESR